MIRVRFVRCNDEHGFDDVQRADGFQKVDGAHHVRFERRVRLPITAPNQWLRGQMHDDFGARGPQSIAQPFSIPNVADHRRHPLLDTQEFERVRLRLRRQRISSHRCAQVGQAQRQPTPLEARVPRQENTPRAPEGLHQRLHGAPLDQRCSSVSLSRMVSNGCQKPTCRNTPTLPPRASRSSGSRSHTVASPSISSNAFGSTTKKPPFTHAPSPCGFSRKRVTSSPSISRTPNRPGGCTAVIVTSAPFERCASTTAEMSTSLTPSPYVQQKV